MRQMRKHRLPHDIQYCLDCALECYDIDAFTANICSIYATSDEMEAVYGRTAGTSAGLSHRDNLKVYALRAMELAHQIAAELSIGMQRAFVAQSILASEYVLTHEAKLYADMYITDQVVGGSFEPFKYTPRMDRFGNVYQKVWNHAESSKAIRKYLKVDAVNFIAHSRKFANKMIERPWPTVLGEGQLVHEIYTKFAEEAKERARLAYANYARTNEEWPVDWEDHCKSIVSERKAQTKQLRKIMTKSVAVAESVIGAEQVAQLRAGERVRMAGESYDYLIGLEGSIAKKGMHALSVNVVSKQSEALGSLCIYWDSMPSMDQAAAFGLNILAGNEQAILDGANKFNVTEKGYEVGLAKHMIIPNNDRSSFVRAIFSNGRLFEKKEIVKTYVQRNLPKYMDVIVPAVWGSRTSQVRKLWHTVDIGTALAA